MHYPLSYAERNAVKDALEETDYEHCFQEDRVVIKSQEESQRVVGHLKRARKGAEHIDRNCLLKQVYNRIVTDED